MHVQNNHKKRISNTLICQTVQRCLSFQTVGIDSSAVYPSCLSCHSFFLLFQIFKQIPGVYGSLRKHFSLYRAVPKRAKERIGRLNRRQLKTNIHILKSPIPYLLQPQPAFAFAVTQIIRTHTTLSSTITRSDLYLKRYTLLDVFLQYACKTCYVLNGLLKI